MKYLCLIYETEANWASYSKEQADSIMGEYWAFTEDIRKNGHWLGGETPRRRCVCATARSPRPTVRSPRRKSSSVATI
jgi:hypothetical protein